MPIEEIDRARSGLSETVENLKSSGLFRAFIEIDNGGEWPLLSRAEEISDHDIQRQISAALRQPGLVRRSGDARSTENVGRAQGREGEGGEVHGGTTDKPKQYRLADYFTETGIDQLAKRNGATSILKVRPWAKHPGRVLAFHGTEAKFDTFDIRKTQDFGLHFGTADQANQFARGPDYRRSRSASGEQGQVFPVVLDLNNVLDLPDLGDWHPPRMLDAMTKAGIRVPPDVEMMVRRGSSDATRGAGHRALRPLQILLILLVPAEGFEPPTP